MDCQLNGVYAHFCNNMVTKYPCCHDYDLYIHIMLPRKCTSQSVSQVPETSVAKD